MSAARRVPAGITPKDYGQARVREHTVDADDITIARFMRFLGANEIGPYSMHVSDSHRSVTFRWVDAPGTRLDVSSFPSFIPNELREDSEPVREPRTMDAMTGEPYPTDERAPWPPCPTEAELDAEDEYLCREVWI